MQFNQLTFGSGLFGGDINDIAVYPTDLCVFDGFSLSDGTNVVTSDLGDGGPTRELIEGRIPRDDGLYLTADYWRQKTIEVRGFVKQSSATLLESFMDTIRKNMRKRQANLDITRNGVVRRYVATLANPESLFPIREHFHVSYIPFTARFVCDTPFAKDRTYTAFSQAITTSPTNLQVYSSGTYKCQPVITLIFDSASSVTVVNVTNTTTGEQIQYSGSIAAGDALVFDSELKRVTKNNSVVDYSGSFPVVDVAYNLLTFTITGSSFSTYATCAFKNTYL